MAEELKIFLVLGILFGALYDFLRFFRLAFKHKFAVFIIDFLFFFVVSPAFFLLLLSYNNGQVRLYYIAAVFAGFLLYLLTIFRLTAKPQEFFARGFRGIVKFCLKSLKKVLQCIKKVYYNKFVSGRLPLIFKRNSKETTGKADESIFYENIP